MNKRDEVVPTSLCRWSPRQLSAKLGRFTQAFGRFMGTLALPGVTDLFGGWVVSDLGLDGTKEVEDWSVERTRVTRDANGSNATLIDACFLFTPR